jgi:hypothetical protein
MSARAARKIVFAAFMAWAASAAPALSATRHVVLLFDERPDLPGLAVLEAQLIRTLTENSPDRIEVYSETMDRSRLPSLPTPRFCEISCGRNTLAKRSISPLPSWGPHSTSC